MYDDEKITEYDLPFTDEPYDEEKQEKLFQEYEDNFDAWLERQREL